MILKVLGLHVLTVAVVLLGLYALNVAKPNAIKAFLSMSPTYGPEFTGRAVGFSTNFFSKIHCLAGPNHCI